MAKKRLLVLFGGISVEHEVSVITGLQLIKHVNAENYEVTPVYIDKKGGWWTGDTLRDITYFNSADLQQPAGLTAFSLNPNYGSNPYDVAILCFHGKYGEAGSVQGLLELAGIPYQGPNVFSSAICFDKIALRQIMGAESIPQPKYVWFTTQQWQRDQAAMTDRVNQLGWPVFVKPANGGSTIGIEKINGANELAAAVERISKFDDRIIVEAAIMDCIEVNVSVLGLEGDVQTSVPEQPIKADEFLSYADKYQRGGGKKSGMASASRRIPAPISSTLTTKVQTIAKHVFAALDCSGVVRIDFMVNPSDESVFVIEPNTIPGSMSYYLWEATSMKYEQLIDKLVEIAEKKAAIDTAFTTSFESNILETKTSI